MANLYWLDQIQLHQRAMVGNKAFYLSQLLQKGFPTVPGFVVSAHLLHQHLEAIEWQEPLFADLPHSSLRLDIENPRQLQAIAQQLRQAIEAPALPAVWLAELKSAIHQLQTPVVSLRPSLLITTTAGMAGKAGTIADGSSSTLFDLQICRATETEVAQGLKRLWAQLFRAKSLFYWQRLGIPWQQVKLAVLVQPLRAAIASGSVQWLGESLQVQSTHGLGMAIAWGEVLPDVYQAEASSGIVQAQQLGKRAIAYQIADSTTTLATAATHDLTPLDSHPQALPLLQAYLLDESQRSCFSLNDTQVSLLLQLVQRVVAAFSDVAALEWTLYPNAGEPDETGEPNPFYLTQLIKVSAQARSQPSQPSPTLVATLHHPLDQTSESVASESVASESVASKSTLSDSGASKPVHSKPMSSELGTSKSASSKPTSSELVSFQQAAKESEVLLVSGLAAAQGRSIARARVISSLHDAINSIPAGMILVAEMLPPHSLSLIQQAAGIVLEQGSMTSHSAIIARELGVPAVIAAAHATRHIQTDDLILVDGDRGTVYRLADMPAAEVDQQATPLITLLAPGDRPSLQTQLMVNLSQPNQLEAIAALPIDGIGLLRGELLALAVLDHQHPLQWLNSGRSAALVERLSTRISQFTAALSPRPVFYRSFDLRSHESRGLPGGAAVPLELNPTLGLHGTLSYCLDSALFDLELAALAQVQTTYSNIHLILPFVRTVEEFAFCRQRVQRAGLIYEPSFQLWIMAEVPSVLFLLPDYVRAGVQGITIGTNDLTQLLFGIDRDHAAMSSVFDAQHPAARAAIAQLVQQANQLGIPCSLCGQAVSLDPELVEPLVRWGITSISVEPGAVETTYRAIAQAEQQLREGVPEQ